MNQQVTATNKRNMEIIQLQDKQEGWRIHRFRTPKERDAELQRHHITFGKNIEIAPYVMLGDHAVLGTAK